MGEVVLKIYNNPLLYTDNDTSEQDIISVLNNIYDSLKDITYRPFKLTGFTNDSFIIDGSPITITVDGVSELTYPFSISWNKSGITLESTGNPNRDQVQMLSLAEQRMKGSYNVLKRTVDETKSEIGNVYGQISTVSQTIDGVQITLQGAIDDVQRELDDHAERQLEYIRYGLGEGLVLGKEGDPISAQLTNSELAFKNGQTKNAYISKDELYISKARIVGAQGQGTGAQLFIGPWQFILRSDGSLDIKVGN